MFEKPTSLTRQGRARFEGIGAEGAHGFSDAFAGAGAGGSGGGLRHIEWGELTARLIAARDFRQVLRRHTARTIGDSAHDFADAAARYFRTKGEGQSNFNPVDLERRKGSFGNGPELTGLNDFDTRPRERLNNGDARND